MTPAPVRHPSTNPGDPQQIRPPVKMRIAVQARTLVSLRADDEPKARASRASMSWMHRLRWVYGIDASVCPNCGGALKVPAVITDPGTIPSILAHVARREARAPALPHPAYRPKHRTRARDDAGCGERNAALRFLSAPIFLRASSSRRLTRARSCHGGSLTERAGLNLLGRFPRLASPSQAGRGAMLQPSVAATCWRPAFIALRLA